MKGSNGGKVMAIRQREEALREYYANPNKCRKCGVVIQVPDGCKVSDVRGRKFCSKSCAAQHNNQGVVRRAALTKTRNCSYCGKEFHPKGKAKFCNQECRQLSWSPSLKSWNSETASKARCKQLEVEEAVAQRLRGNGWEIFSPTVVCDRVGIKDGKVFFLEFKPEGKENLRPGQRRVFECVPEMYQVITHSKFVLN